MNLSKAEQDVRVYIEKGYSNEEIANQLCITIKTVKFHLTNIYKKAGVKSRAEFMAKIYDNQNIRGKIMSANKVEVLDNPQDKRNMSTLPKSQEDKILFIDNQFKVSNTVEHLHSMMKDVTKKEINPATVNAACNCVARLNETINTAIQAARFLNER